MPNHMIQTRVGLIIVRDNQSDTNELQSTRRSYLKFTFIPHFTQHLHTVTCNSLHVYRTQAASVLFAPHNRNPWPTGPDEKTPISLVTPPHTQQFMGNGYQMASFNMVTRIDGTEGFNSQSIEERNFQAALIMTECHFTRKPPIGRKTVNMTLATIKRTMEKTLNVSEIRYCYMWLCLAQGCH